MCGLVGMVGTLEYKHKQAMRDLFFLNTLRGKDSTGISAVNRKKEVSTRKLTVPGYDFIDHPIVDKAYGSGDQLWIGHGRYKTTGDVNRMNAHPFEVMDDEGLVMLVGAHNGTLHNKYMIENKAGVKFDTDSEVLFHWLTKAKDYKTAISALRGAWSLVWWDPTSDSLHFCRNKERPLTFAWSKDEKVLIWASEAWMIINACRRNGVELLQNERGLSCYSTLEDHLYTLEIPQEKDKVLPDLKKEGGYTGDTVTNFQGNGYNWFGQRQDQWWDDDPSHEQETTKKAAQKGKADTQKTSNVVAIGGGVRGFEGKPVSHAELKKIKDKGCGWCKEPIPDKSIFSFVTDDRVICYNCMTDKHPKGTNDLDDDLPFELTDKGKEEQTKSPEYKKLVEIAAKKVVG